MSFNKAKALKAASKYVQQGKFQAAIEEYRKIVQAEPSDITTLNTMGDLYVKIGDTGEAIRTFLRIAEHYRAGGFNLKAIAMLKKVSKLDPNNVEVSLKLAGLYAQQKLIVDARQQYLAVAEHYLRAGQQKPALDIYQKIAALDPENTSIQLKLAEAYLHEQQIEQAYEAFIAAAAELQRQGKYDEALEIYLKALQVRPAAQRALNSAVNLYIQRGEAGRAAELIMQLLRNQPRNAELLTLLGRIHQSASELDEAEEALSRAVEIDPARFQYLLDFAECAMRNGDAECALRQIDRVMEQLYERREEEKAIAILHEILARDPSHFGALERLAAIFARIREDHNLIDTLNSLADAAIRKGEDDVAIKALAQLAQLEPDEIKHRRRLRSLGLTDDEVRRLSDSLQNSASSLSTAPREVTDRAKLNQQATAPVTGEMPVPPFSGTAWGEIEINEFASPAETASPRTSGTVSSYGEVEIAPPQPEHNQPFTFSQDEIVDDSAEAWAQHEGTAGSGFEFNAAIDLSGDLHDELVTSSVVTEVHTEADSPRQPVTFSAVVAEPPLTGTDGFGADFAESGEVSGGLKLSDELESVDFYLAQEMFDVARHTIEMLENHFPGHPAVRERRTRLMQSDPASRSAAGFSSALKSNGNFHQETGEAEQIVLLAPSPESGSEFFESDLVTTSDDLNFLGATEEKPRTPFRIPAGNSDLQPGFPLDGFLDELDSFHADTASGMPLNSKPVAQTAPAVMVGTEMNGPASSLNDLFSLFDEFKSGTEQQEADTGDFDTHYNLGLAYKDMEMYDEAVEEFQQGYKALSADASETARQNQLLCCSLLGFCFSQKNLPRLAVMWLRRGLEVPGRPEDEYQALRYDLAAAYEAMGELQNAHDVLQEVYAIDVNYRNVSARLSEVQSQLSRS
ncbi:MAG TPA: tetratricopeptide repeat protein [Blastocatellia bacterium]|nr:tetratricopeptide repeat protein [Blastocatellia bacterium]